MYLYEDIDRDDVYNDIIIEATLNQCAANLRYVEEEYKTNLLLAEARVIAANGTTEDFEYLCESADNKKAEDKKGIFATIFDAIVRFIKKIKDKLFGTVDDGKNAGDKIKLVENLAADGKSIKEIGTRLMNAMTSFFSGNSTAAMLELAAAGEAFRNLSLFSSNAGKVAGKVAATGAVVMITRAELRRHREFTMKLIDFINNNVRKLEEKLTAKATSNNNDESNKSSAIASLIQPILKKLETFLARCNFYLAGSEADSINSTLEADNKKLAELTVKLNAETDPKKKEAIQKEITALNEKIEKTNERSTNVNEYGNKSRNQLIAEKTRLQTEVNNKTVEVNGMDKTKDADKIAKLNDQIAKLNKKIAKINDILTNKKGHGNPSNPDNNKKNKNTNNNNNNNNANNNQSNNTNTTNNANANNNDTSDDTNNNNNTNDDQNEESYMYDIDGDMFVEDDDTSFDSDPLSYLFGVMDDIEYID